LISNIDIHALPDRILVAPLNWGLGHASRCIPLIRLLLDAGKTVQLASDGQALVFLRRAFPDLPYHELPAYDIQYKHSTIEKSILLQSIKILSAIKREKKTTAQIIERENIELIISDNRYGVRNDHVKSIIITHQIRLLSAYKFFGKPGTWLNKKWIQKFDACWIPDYPESKLSGRMSSEKIGTPKIFIGPLTRIEKEILPTENEVLAIVSGPEPMRSRFANKLFSMLAKQSFSSIIIDGKVSDKIVKITTANLTRYNFLDSEKLNKLINQSKIIICRSGYSSIMDLCHMQKKVVLVPTPGQTEQVYLAEYLNGNYGFKSIGEEELEKEFPLFIDRML
jgi:uncharacterized protein (TIGR00661 family)